MRASKLRAVVIGTGFGTRAHVPALRSAGFDVISVVGRDPEKTSKVAAKMGIEHAFSSISNALDLKPDVVAVASPPHTHAEMTRQAFASGAHVVCEKPFTRTLDEAAELCALAENSGLIGLLCHEFRYIPSTALFGRLVESGAIGEPRFTTLIAHCDLVADPAGPRPDWWFDKSTGGGWFGASGSHGIDRIQDWYGEIVGVGAQLRYAAERPATSADDSFTIQFLTRSGVTGTFESTAAAWGPKIGLQRASGTGGTMWIEDESGSGIIESLTGSLHIADKGGAREIVMPGDLALPDDEHTRRWWLIAVLASLYRELAHMIDGGTIKRRFPRPATFEDGYRNMRVMDAVRRSAEQAQWIAVGGNPGGITSP